MFAASTLSSKVALRTSTPLVAPSKGTVRMATHVNKKATKKMMDRRPKKVGGGTRGLTVVWTELHIKSRPWEVVSLASRSAWSGHAAAMPIVVNTDCTTRVDRALCQDNTVASSTTDVHETDGTVGMGDRPSTYCFNGI